MMFEVRKASPDDHGAMTPLFEAFYREEGFDHAVEAVAGNLSQILRRGDTAAFVAVADNSVIGVAALSTSFGLEAGFYCELEDLYVVPAARGQGVATALIDAACDWASRAGCRDMEIVVTEHGMNEAGLMPFYAKHGFTETGRMIMERTL